MPMAAKTRLDESTSRTMTFADLGWVMLEGEEHDFNGNEFSAAPHAIFMLHIMFALIGISIHHQNLKMRPHSQLTSHATPQ